jgi:(p)ppGpp synthase/HD superfamily hydrolase
MGSMTSEALYSERLDDALGFAAETFRHITRKDGGTPYLWHLLEVGAMVGEAGGDESQVIAALLHDYLEDIDGGSSALLASRFGAGVAELVGIVSDTTVRPKPPWRQRKESHIARMHAAPAAAKLIALCDKLHNARATLRDIRLIGDAVWERFSAPKAETLWYYRAMYAAIADGYTSPLLSELEALVKELHAAAGAPLSQRL